MLNIMSASWTALPCGCYILSETDSISMLPISDYAWTEQQFMQLVSTFTDVYYKDVSAPLESICYLGPHVWYIKENKIKQAYNNKYTNNISILKLWQLHTISNELDPK